MIDDIKFCTSERKPIGYMVDQAASQVAGEPVYRCHLVWAEGRPADLAIGREALPAGYVIPGSQRRVPERQEAMRIAERISRAVAGYGS